jgi:hypothetical protein
VKLTYTSSYSTGKWEDEVTGVVVIPAKTINDKVLVKHPFKEWEGGPESAVERWYRATQLDVA